MDTTQGTYFEGMADFEPSEQDKADLAASQIGCFQCGTALSFFKVWNNRPVCDSCRSVLKAENGGQLTCNLSSPTIEDFDFLRYLDGR